MIARAKTMIAKFARAKMQNRINCKRNDEDS